jgi:hypothetical protein
LDTWILVPEWYFTSWFVDNTSSSNQTSLMQDLDPMDLLPKHPKSFWGCIKWLQDGWEAMVWVPWCWLWTPGFWPHRMIFHKMICWIQQQPNQPDARLRAHGSPSQPSKIILGMYQVNWDNGWEAMVWMP